MMTHLRAEWLVNKQLSRQNLLHAAGPKGALLRHVDVQLTNHMSGISLNTNSTIYSSKTRATPEWNLKFVFRAGVGSQAALFASLAGLGIEQDVERVESI